MTLLVHKQIKKFRLSQNMKQNELASLIGVSGRLLSNFEIGKSYPANGYIAQLNRLGAEIHPSIFSPVAQKLTAAIRRKVVDFRRMKNEPSFLEGVKISKHERLWIQDQLLKKGLRQVDIAAKAGCKAASVSFVLKGGSKSRNIQRAIAEILGFSSFTDLQNACKEEKITKKNDDNPYIASPIPLRLPARPIPSEFLVIRQWLAAKGIKQKEIAKKANCGERSVASVLCSSVLCGKTRSKKIEAVIADALGYPSWEALWADAVAGAKGGEG